MSDFYDKVYEVVRLIPAGKVTSYGAIATYLGTAQSSRMVGWAMNNAHGQDKYVPAHRVVNRNGLLSGKHHFGSGRISDILFNKKSFIIFTGLGKIGKPRNRYHYILIIDQNTFCFVIFIGIVVNVIAYYIKTSLVNIESRIWND